MPRDEENIARTKKLVADVKGAAARGVTNPEQAAGHLCRALVMLMEAAERWIAEMDKEHSR